MMSTEPKVNRREVFLSELSELLAARYPLLFLQTYEEARTLDIIKELCEKRSYNLYLWNRTAGLQKSGTTSFTMKDPAEVLKWCEELTEKAVIVLLDFHPYMKDPGISRRLRDLSQSLKKTKKSLFFVSPVAPLPVELLKDIALVEVPLPSREEIRECIEKVASAFSLPSQESSSAKDSDALVDAASGLTLEEIENVLARSLVSQGKLDKALIHEEKKQLVKKSGILEFIDVSRSEACDVGGLVQLKSWLSSRRVGFSAEARELGLPAPKGLMLVGIPGCGKSLTAITVGRQWELPLLRLDIGRVFSGIVGSSEGNMRDALRTAEAVAPCVLWIDEIEKGFSGSQSSGSTDGGTTSRVFGTVLTWMQEKKAPVFVLATANDISALPPEFLRKGRFDEIFFVDLPTVAEREEILKIHLTHRNWESNSLDLAGLAELSDGFSGAELEQALIAARFTAFHERTGLQQQHVTQALSETVPLSKTMSDRIEALREWAAFRARMASGSIETQQQEKSQSRLEQRARSLERREAL